jgi:hypothetical protein
LDVVVSLKGRDHSEDIGIDGRRMLERKTECEGVDWMDLAQGRDQWRAVVNTVINLQFP